MKKIFFLFLVFLFSAPVLKAQYNPYLDKKKKNKPSAVMARQNKKDLRRQKRMAKRQMKHSRRHVNRRTR